MKTGQIAHLDKDNSNNVEQNLAFLCFHHHDEYDCRTSQRKGFTAEEVIEFREELYRAVDKALSIEVHFGAVTLPKDDPYAGHYIRVSDERENASAEVAVTPLPDGVIDGPQYAITGSAFFGIDREHGPNMGSLAFIESARDGIIEHSRERASGAPHSIRMTFLGKRLIVEEKNWFSEYGNGVAFIGEYERS